MSNDLEKLCPTFLQTPNEAGIIAFLFNEFMDLDARNSVPEDVAKEIGQYMHSKGYVIVFNKFYKQREEIASGSHAVQSDAANEQALDALKEFTSVNNVELELIGKQAFEIHRLKTEVNELRQKIEGARCSMTCIGGPLNDNKLQFNKEQLRLIRQIHDELEG